MLTMWFMVNACFCSPEALGHVVSVWPLEDLEMLVDNRPSLCQWGGLFWYIFRTVICVVPRGVELKSLSLITSSITHALLLLPLPFQVCRSPLSFHFPRLPFQISHQNPCSWFLSGALLSGEPKLGEFLLRQFMERSSFLVTGMQM